MTPPRPGSIAATLQEQRLEYRRNRVGKVLEALRERERELGEAPTPAGLSAAMRDYAAELREIERNIADLQPRRADREQPPRRSLTV